MMIKLSYYTNSKVNLEAGKEITTRWGNDKITLKLEEDAPGTPEWGGYIDAIVSIAEIELDYYPNIDED